MTVLLFLYMVVGAAFMYVSVLSLDRIMASHRKVGVYWSVSTYKWVILVVSLLWLPALLLYLILEFFFG